MAVGDAGYLPPVVASLQAEAGQFVTKVGEAKALLADFARSDTETQLGADTLRFEAKLTAVKVRLLNFAREVTRTQLGADAAPFWTEIAKLRAEVAAMSPMDIDVRVRIAESMAKLAALRGSLTMMRLDRELGTAAHAGEAAAGGRGGALGGFLRSFGWGTGMLGMAGFGTPLGLAGFGPEHLITTGLGLAGSAGGGLLGGGLLGLGELGVSGVGMGSDAAVMRSTLADTQQLGNAYQRLQQDTLLYGANSRQAALDTKLLNAQMAMLGNTAGVQAEMGLVKAANAVNSQWDQATSAARVQAVNLMTQVLGLASTYIPLVAGAAARNLGIINTAIKPLFTWLQGPATEIFSKLENMFASRLPTAVDAFTQGIELLIKTISVASNYTGGFLPKLDRFLQYANSPTGFAKWSKDIGTLIGLFRVWERFIKDVAVVLFHLFSQSAGLGAGIVTTLSQMLEQLDKWLTGTGKGQVHNLFEAHKQQILALLQILPALARFAPIFVQFSIAATLASIPLIKLATTIGGLVLKLSGALGPIGSFALGLGVIEMRSHLLTSTFNLLTNTVNLLGGSFRFAAKILEFSRAFIIMAQAEGIATAATTALGISEGIALGPIIAIVAGVLLLAAGIYLLITHWNQVRAAILHVAQVISNFITQHKVLAAILIYLSGPIGMVIAGVALLITHWSQVSAILSKVKDAIVKFVTTALKDFEKFFGNLISNVEHGWKLFTERPLYWIGFLLGYIPVKLTLLLVQFVKFIGHLILLGAEGFRNFVDTAARWISELPGRIWTWLQQTIGKIKDFAVHAPENARTAAIDIVHAIVTEVQKLPGQMVGLGHDIIQGLINGIKGMAGDVANAVANIISGALAGGRQAAQSHSPSRLFETMLGITIPQGIALGIAKGEGAVVASMVGLNNAMARTARSLTQPSFGAGGMMLAGAGATHASINMPITVHVTGGNASNPQAIGNAVAQEVGRHMTMIVKSLKGGAYLTPGQGL